MIPAAKPHNEDAAFFPRQIRQVRAKTTNVCIERKTVKERKEGINLAMTLVAPRKVVSKLSCQGTTIGQCLREALDDVNKGSNEEKSKDNNDSEEPPTLKLDEESISRIMDAFGEAAASTICGTNNKDDNERKRKPNPNNPTLLKGRLDHYNRVGQHWRIVIDGVEMKRRSNSNRIANLKKKPTTSRNNRESLWESSKGPAQKIQKQEKLQILAYNDS